MYALNNQKETFKSKRILLNIIVLQLLLYIVVVTNKI